MSRLGKEKTGRMNVGVRFGFYGVESVGKTTLAAHAPSPIFFDIEDGTATMDVPRYTFRDGDDGHMPQDLSDVINGIHDLLEHDHSYKTLVIDTVDRLEPLIWSHCLARDSARSSNLNPKGKKLSTVEDYGYGKGYVVALDEWRRVCALLDRLRLRKGMNIVLLGHAIIRLFKNPSGEDYDRFHLGIHDKAAGFVKEWLDVVGFCCYEEGSEKLSSSDSRAKGYSTGRRLMYTERTAAYDAKSRLALPSEIELDPKDPWGPIGAALAAGPKDLRALIKVELERLGDPKLSAKVADAVKKAKNDSGLLSRYLAKLQRTETQREENAA